MSIATLATLDELKAYLGLTSPTAQQSAVLEVVRKGVQRLLDNFLGRTLVQATYTEYYPVANNMAVRSDLIDSYEVGGGNRVFLAERLFTEKRVLQLGAVPVRSITSVYENPDAWLTAGGDWPASTLLTDGADYYLDLQEPGLSLTGFLVRNIGPWTSSHRSVKITYVAGYTPDEIAADYPDLAYAYYSQVQVSYNQEMMHMLSRNGGAGAIVQQHIDSWGEQYDATTNAQLYGKQGRLAPHVARMLEPYINYGRFLV